MIIGVKRLFAFYFYRTQIMEDYQNSTDRPAVYKGGGRFASLISFL